MKSKNIVGTVAAAVIGFSGIGSAVAMAGSASAATHPVLTSTTHIVNRDDNGGSGTKWAMDTMDRVQVLTYLGKVSAADIAANPALAATPFMYSATISDHGTFRDIPGSLAPNQGGRHFGQHLRPVQVSGPMSGFGQFNIFYASSKAHNGLVPTVLKGEKLNALYPSSQWPTLSFPVGTTFAGLNEAAYDYSYHAVPVFGVKKVNGKNVTVVLRYKQNWEDASWNGDGQAPRDGQVLGLR